MMNRLFFASGLLSSPLSCLLTSWMLLMMILSTSLAFSVLPSTIRASPRITAIRVSREEIASSEPGPNVVNGDDVFHGAEFLEFSLSPHRPLGCTVEESLATVQKTQTITLHNVFVSKVVPGGFAEQAGLQAGDVVVGVSGVFGDLEPVKFEGIDRVKGLVTARPKEEALQLRVARGTTVMQDHERVLVELCSDPTLDGSEVEECVINYLQGGYHFGAADVNEDFSPANDIELDGANVDDDDHEDLVHNLHHMWAEDLPAAAAAPELPDETTKQPKAKPWSSRSSPSGTFVRDPATGKMRNID